MYNFTAQAQSVWVRWIALRWLEYADHAPIVVRYLQTGDESIRQEAMKAARFAAQEATAVVWARIGGRAGEVTAKESGRRWRAKWRTELVWEACKLSRSSQARYAARDLAGWSAPDTVTYDGAWTEERNYNLSIKRHLRDSTRVIAKQGLTGLRAILASPLPTAQAWQRPYVEKAYKEGWAPWLAFQLWTHHPVQDREVGAQYCQGHADKSPAPLILIDHQ